MGSKHSKKKYNKEGQKQKMCKVGLSLGRNDLKLEGNFQLGYHSKNVIFLATFHKFLQFCLSNSDVSTTFGHFSQKSPLCRCGSYTHGSQ